MRSIFPEMARREGLAPQRNLALLVAAGLAVAAGLGAIVGLGAQVVGVASLLGLTVLSSLRFKHWPLWLTLLVIAWLPFQNITVAGLYIAGQLSLPAAQVLVLLKEGLVLGLLIVLAATGRAWRWGLTDVLFILYLLWVVSYLPRGDLSLTARAAGVRMLTIPLLLYFLGRFLPAPPAAPKYILLTVLATASIVALWGWVEWFLVDIRLLGELQAANALAKGQSLPTLRFGMLGAFYTAIGSAFTGDVIWVRRMISTYLEALSLGHALILPVTFLFFVLVAMRKPVIRPRLLVAALLALVALTQVMSISRGALLASGLAGGLVVLSIRRARLPGLALLAVALTATMLVPRARSFVLLTLRQEDPSTLAHVSQLQLGWQLAREAPLGLGLGHGGYVGLQFAPEAAEGTYESFYFSMISQVGLIGAALFVLGTLRLIWSLWKTYRATQQPWLRTAAMVTLAALAGYSFSAVFSEAAFGMLSAASTWLLAGVVVQLGYRERRADATALVVQAPVSATPGHVE